MNRDQNIRDIAKALRCDLGLLESVVNSVTAVGSLRVLEIHQLHSAGIPIVTYLAKKLDKTKEEVHNIARQEGFSISTMNEALQLMTEEGELCYIPS